MSIKMYSLTSFLGVEGLIKKGVTFDVRDKVRADYLESVHFAKRADQGDPATKEQPYQTQEQQPAQTQAIAPDHIGEQGPENTQEPEPQELKELSYQELKQKAKTLGIEGYNRMKKEDLINALK